MGKRTFRDWLLGKNLNLVPALDPATVPAQEEINEDEADNKVLAQAIHAELTKNADLLRQANLDTARWISTSLLAVNAGGAVAMTQLEISSGLRVTAGLSFVLGMILTLIGSQVGTTMGWRLMSDLGGLTGYWFSVMNDGFRIRDTELKMNDIQRTAAEAAIWPTRLGYIATALFCVGVACSAIGIWRN